MQVDRSKQLRYTLNSATVKSMRQTKEREWNSKRKIHRQRKLWIPNPYHAEKGLSMPTKVGLGQGHAACMDPMKTAMLPQLDPHWRPRHCGAHIFLSTWSMSSVVGGGSQVCGVVWRIPVMWSRSQVQGPPVLVTAKSWASIHNPGRARCLLCMCSYLDMVHLCHVVEAAS